MKRENYSIPELGIHDAEKILYTLEPELHAFFSEHTSTQLSYAVTDVNDERLMVGITGAHLRWGAPDYDVSTQHELFRVHAVHKTCELYGRKVIEPKISVRRYSADDKLFLPPTDADFIRVAQLLDRVNMAEVKRDIDYAEQQQKVDCGRKLFGLINRKTR